MCVDALVQGGSAWSPLGLPACPRWAAPRPATCLAESRLDNVVSSPPREVGLSEVQRGFSFQASLLSITVGLSLSVSVCGCFILVLVFGTAGMASQTVGVGGGSHPEGWRRETGQVLHPHRRAEDSGTNQEPG